MNIRIEGGKANCDFESNLPIEQAVESYLNDFRISEPLSFRYAGIERGVKGNVIRFKGEGTLGLVSTLIECIKEIKENPEKVPLDHSMLIDEIRKVNQKFGVGNIMDLEKMVFLDFPIDDFYLEKEGRFIGMRGEKAYMSEDMKSGLSLAFEDMHVDRQSLMQSLSEILRLNPYGKLPPEWDMLYSLAREEAPHSFVKKSLNFISTDDAVLSKFISNWASSGKENVDWLYEITDIVDSGSFKRARMLDVYLMEGEIGASVLMKVLRNSRLTLDTDLRKLPLGKGIRETMDAIKKIDVGKAFFIDKHFCEEMSSLTSKARIRFFGESIDSYLIESSTGTVGSYYLRKGSMEYLVDMHEPKARAIPNTIDLFEDDIKETLRRLIIGFLPKELKLRMIQKDYERDLLYKVSPGSYRIGFLKGDGS